MSRQSGGTLARGAQARRPRLDDVAADVGVSPATVSLVLRGIAGPSADTRERVLEAAARLDYRPDRAASVLASRRSRLLGIVMDISNPFHTQLVQDFYSAARLHNYHLVLSTITPEHDERAAVETLLDSRCEGLVLLGGTASTPHLHALVDQLPIVVVGRPALCAGVDTVRTDDARGLELAVAHLTGLGHTRISYVDGGTDAASPIRSSAYQHAMQRHHLSDHIEIVQGGDTETAGAAAATVLLRSRAAPTGVITFNDRAAVGLVDILVRAGVDVPRAISVIGYDDSPVARLGHVDLTTISQDTAQLAQHAMVKLIDRLEGSRTDDWEVVVPPRLTIRSTTAAALGVPDGSASGPKPIPGRVTAASSGSVSHQP
jgi:DNA-binding LacI/PurR family transcriptional regulator